MQPLSPSSCHLTAKAVHCPCSPDTAVMLVPFPRSLCLSNSVLISHPPHAGCVLILGFSQVSQSQPLPTPSSARCFHDPLRLLQPHSFSVPLRMLLQGWPLTPCKCHIRWLLAHFSLAILSSDLLLLHWRTQLILPMLKVWLKVSQSTCWKNLNLSTQRQSWLMIVQQEACTVEQQMWMAWSWTPQPQVGVWISSLDS